MNVHSASPGPTAPKPSPLAILIGTMALYWRLRRRLWAALIFAPPVAAALLVVCLAPIEALAGLGPTPSTLLMQWQALALPALMTTWTVGLAWHALACRMKWRRLSVYILAAALGGAALGLGFVIAVQPLWESAFRSSPAPVSLLVGALSALFAGGLGGVSMGLFWLFRRPDRDDGAPDLAGEFD